MKTKILIGTLLIVTFALAGCNGAAGIIKPSSTYDFTGTWDGSISQSSQSGVCPPMPSQQGIVMIEQNGNSFTLQYGAGFDCNPPEACFFTGTVDGLEYTAENSGFADSEGGVYASSLYFVAESDHFANVFGSSSYTHPDGQCTWETMGVITKK